MVQVAGGSKSLFAGMITLILGKSCLTRILKSSFYVVRSETSSDCSFSDCGREGVFLWRSHKWPPGAGYV